MRRDRLVLSVVVPIHDVAPGHLSAALDSVLAQEVDAVLEVLVVDDASSIDYSAVKAAFASRGVRFFRQPTNEGMVATWNAAVRRSTGTLVLLLGQDDLLMPGMLRAYVAAFERDPGIALCACGRQFIDEHGNQVQPLRFVNDRRHIFSREDTYWLQHCDAVRLCLRNGNVIGEPSAVMYRRSVFDRIRGYDPAFRHAADLDFNLRAAQHGSILYFGHEFIARRLRRDSLTRKNLSACHVTYERMAIFERHVATCKFDPNAIDGFRAYLAAAALFDLARGIMSANFRVIHAALNTGMRNVPRSMRAVRTLVGELVTRTNVDAR